MKHKFKRGDIVYYRADDCCGIIVGINHAEALIWWTLLDRVSLGVYNLEGLTKLV